MQLASLEVSRCRHGPSWLLESNHQCVTLKTSNRALTVEGGRRQQLRVEWQFRAQDLMPRIAQHERALF